MSGITGEVLGPTQVGVIRTTDMEIDGVLHTMVAGTMVGLDTDTDTVMEMAGAVITMAITMAGEEIAA